MAKFTVGGQTPSTGGSGPPRINAQRDVELTFMGSEHVEANPEYVDSVPQHRFDWRIDDGPEVEDEDVGRIWSVWVTYPKPGSKPHPKSNMYGQLEAVAGAAFDPDAEETIDTDDYKGRKYLGDFKDVPAQVKDQASGKFVPRKDEQGRTVLKSKLENVRPPRTAAPRRRRAQDPAPAEQSFDWDADENVA